MEELGERWEIIIVYNVTLKSFEALSSRHVGVVVGRWDFRDASDCLHNVASESVSSSTM